jgi:hypothetical protein
MHLRVKPLPKGRSWLHTWCGSPSTQQSCGMSRIVMLAYVSPTQGALRVSRFNPFEGWVGSEAVGADILITGRLDMNRAMDGGCLGTTHACDVQAVLE